MKTAPLIPAESVSSLEEALEVLRYPTDNPVLIGEVEEYLKGKEVRPEVRVALAMALDCDVSEIPE